MSTRVQQTSPVLVALAWTFVLIPLGWGVYQSVLKAIPLFKPVSLLHG